MVVIVNLCVFRKKSNILQQNGYFFHDIKIEHKRFSLSYMQLYYHRTFSRKYYKFTSKFFPLSDVMINTAANFIKNV